MMMAGLVAAAATGCSKAASPTAPSPEITTTAGSAAAPRAMAGGQSALAGVRAATAAFHDADKAIAAGYASPVGGHCDTSPAGVMGVHAANAGLVQNPTLDPATPEVLLYLPTGGGNYRLVGVEYLQTVLVRNTLTGAVSPWFSHDPWPSHFVVVNPAPSLFGQTFQGPMAGHFPGMPWHYDLHVWAWAPNPAGMFAQWNPALTCS